MSDGHGVVTRGLRSTIGRESTTFGFSILVTVSFGMMQATHGPPDVTRIFLFAAGAGASFIMLEGTLSKGFRKPMPQHPTRTQAAGTSMNLLSVVAGLGIVWGVGSVVPHAAGWAVAPFLGATTYLVLESLEIALAERLLVAHGDTDAGDVSP